jgi:hypothetical protein
VRNTWKARNEPGGIFLVVTVSHGERGQRGVVLRECRLAVGDGHISLVERERDLAGDVGLRAFDERRNNPSGRGRPLSILLASGKHLPNLLGEPGSGLLVRSNDQDGVIACHRADGFRPGLGIQRSRNGMRAAHGHLQYQEVLRIADIGHKFAHQVFGLRAGPATISK